MLESLIGHGISCQGKNYEIIGATGGDAYSMGGPTVFDVFDLSPYIFYKIKRGTPVGDVVEESFSAEGVFKLRSGLIQNQNAENVEQGARLHIRPTETFVEEHTVNREHYTLTLVPTELNLSESS